MTNYRMCAGAAMALSLACWGLATGLAVEKIWSDGLTSYTLLFAMPVLTLSIGWLIHQGVSDLRELQIIRGAVCFVIALAALSVVLPNSIGSSGAARDSAVAEAQASNRGLLLAEGGLAKAKNDLATADAGVLKECEGAPEVIPNGRWPKCQWWRRQVTAHSLAVAELEGKVSTAPAEKAVMSGESRIAWAAEKAGLAITEDDVMMAMPMALPVVLELLCAFAMFMALEFRRLAEGSVSKAVSGDPELAKVTDADLESLRRTFVVDDEAPAPTPPKPRKRKGKRQQKREKVHNWVREYTLENGHPPAFGVVKGRFHLPAATASRWRNEALKAG